MDKILELLRKSSLRPTKQRLMVGQLLFNGVDKHVTAESLYRELKESDQKISLATVYNTVHALKTKGYLKEISINTDRSYFDTNISHHHHFFDKSTEELIDLSDEDVEKIQIKKSLLGKKISSVEVLVKVENE